MMTRQSGDIDNLEMDRQNLITELEQMRSELMGMSSENDSMALYVDSEVERMSFMIKELEGKNNMTAAEIDKAKRQIKQLQSDKNKLVAQVDSVNRAYQALAIEKAQVEEVLQEEVVKNESLNTENRDLKKDVAVGSMLTLSKMEVSTYKVKGVGKESATNSAKSVERVKACYTISKNNIAPRGERAVYMRITTPDLKVMAFQGDESNVFTFNGQPLMYSAKQAMFYENDLIESCINMDRDGGFVKGEYTVELFTEGYKLGESKFVLK
jgi:regulator of replication initiation timing